MEPAEQTSQTEEHLTNLFDTDQTVLHQIQEVDKQRRLGNNNNSLPIVKVAIPQSITIDCPLVRPMLLQARQCQGCEYFKGIAQTAWSDEAQIPWEHKYAIRCGFVLERKTRQLVTEV